MWLTANSISSMWLIARWRTTINVIARRASATRWINGKRKKKIESMVTYMCRTTPNSHMHGELERLFSLPQVVHIRIDK